MNTPASPLGTLGRIPLEIRRQIYEEVFANGYLIAHTERLPGFTHKEMRLSILEVSRTIHAEAITELNKSWTAKQVLIELRYCEDFNFGAIAPGKDLSAIRDVKINVCADSLQIFKIWYFNHSQRSPTIRRMHHPFAEDWEIRWRMSFVMMINGLGSIKKCEISFILSKFKEQTFPEVSLHRILKEEMFMPLKSLEQVTTTVDCCNWQDASPSSSEAWGDGTPDPFFMAMVPRFRKTFMLYLGECTSMRVEEPSNKPFFSRAFFHFHPRASGMHKVQPWSVQFVQNHGP
ncbi:uncharacterized protein KY384_002963 [Bacidia gigantensis]|uniref:uncharacterized protein n=1 Tax=Bacidia gigantensis TaxID=2732470 RepID=UPI001D040EBC|nr:uncharacterized protein KY384_002963 [Bacidia gigantensis]KAG8531334.1 hypothetical protein KY384_002963 [Bacidia gigantensis]